MNVCTAGSRMQHVRHCRRGCCTAAYKYLALLNLEPKSAAFFIISLRCDVLIFVPAAISFSRSKGRALGSSTVSCGLDFGCSSDREVARVFSWNNVSTGISQ